MRVIIATILGTLLVSGVAVSGGFNLFDKTPVNFYAGHSHADGVTHGAPQHSGGTDRKGCHNGSVPYHCH